MSVNIGSTVQEILNEINNKINKTTYEASAELDCSSNGKVCLGKFGAYDTNITIELNSTTSTTYHATIVIWSQNVEPNATKGSVGCNVYGDADNNITPLISVFRPYGSANRQIEVYADLPGWSKNLVHIQGVAISTGGMTDVLTSVNSIPTAIDGKIKVTPINVLKSMFASKDVATTSTAGLMSAADKIKLDNVLTLASVREDSSGNVVVANDLKVQGGADFTDDVTVGSLTVDAGLQMNDDVEINYQYGVRWTDDNDSGLATISRNEDTGKLEVHYADNELTSGVLATVGDITASLDNALKGYLPLTGGTLTGNLTGKYLTGTWLQSTANNALSSKPPRICVQDNSGWIYSRTPAQILEDIGAASVGADQIKGIYATAGNRSIWDVDATVGITFQEKGTLFKDENASSEITETLFVQRLPIVAGNNVTFETDTENQVVKINATGGGTSGGTPTKIGDDENYVEVTLSNGDIVGQGTTIHFLGSDYQEFVTGDSDQTSMVLKPDSLSISSPNTNIYGLGILSTADGDVGSEGQVLMSNGQNVYWGDAPSGGGTPSKIEKGDSYVEAVGSGVDINGDVLNITGDTISIKDEQSTNSIYLDSVDGVVIDGSHIKIGECVDTGIEVVNESNTVGIYGDDISIGGAVYMDGGAMELHPYSVQLEPQDGDVIVSGATGIYLSTTTNNSDETIRLRSEIVEIFAESTDGVGIYAENGNVTLDCEEVHLNGTLKMYTNGSYGNNGQVLMSNGETAYWGDVEGSSGGGSPMTPITYAELKALRDSGKLVAGMFYRITDYVCTTVQADTRAMSNRFDIIVQALSNNTLSETAKADYNAEDNYFKIESGGNALVEGSVSPVYYEYIDYGDMDMNMEPSEYKTEDGFIAYDYLENNEGQVVPVIYKTNTEAAIEDPEVYGEPDYYDIFYYIGTEVVDNVTYDKWRKIHDSVDSDLTWDSTGKIYLYTNVIVENNEIISSVKASGIKYNANLPAWELKYSLDNDTTRFAWADETNGKGIIYFMKDENGNECPYDFKNIQFRRSTEWQEEHTSFITDSLCLSIGDVEWFYTFSWVNENLVAEDLTIRQDLTDDCGDIPGTKNNKMHFYNAGSRTLNNNLIISSYQYDSGCFYGVDNNIFGVECFSNTLGNGCSMNIFGCNCHNNTFGNDCCGNKFEYGFNNNTVGNACSSNIFCSTSESYNNNICNDSVSNYFAMQCAQSTIYGSYNFVACGFVGMTLNESHSFITSATT